MIVLDTSAAIEIARGTEMGHTFERLTLGGEKIISVDLLYGEVCSSFAKYVKAGMMTKDQAAQMVERAIGLVDTFVPMRDLYPEAFSESLRLAHSPYDMFNFVLTRRTAGTLFTMDQRLIRLALQNSLSCVYEDAPEGSDPWTIRFDAVERPGCSRTREGLVGRV